MEKGYGHTCVVHASHLAPFDKPYVEPKKITLDGFEEIAKPN